jgi:hypothetical protein
MADIILTEEQLTSLVSKVKNKTKIQEESHDDGSYMAKQQLYMIATMAYAMWEQMPEGEQLEDWMESKIAQCSQSVTAVVQSYMYKDVTEKGGMDRLNYDEIIIGK